MSDHQLTPSQKAFVADIRALRQASGVSLSALSEETKILRHTLEEFETSGNLYNPLFGRLYLRSLAGAYASAIGLDMARMHAALDQALADTYDGELSPGGSDNERAGGEDQAEAEHAAVPKPDSSPVSNPDLEPPASEAIRLGAPRGPELYSARRRRRVNRRWAAPRGLVIGGGAVIIVMIVTVVWLLAGRGEPPPQELGGTSAVGSQSPDPPAAVSARTLPESYYVTIHAAHGLVVRMPVVVDGFRRECWIEVGEAKALRVRDTLVIERLAYQTRLYVGDFEVPKDSLTSRFELSRSYFEASPMLAVGQLPAIVDTVRPYPNRGC